MKTRINLNGEFFYTEKRYLTRIDLELEMYAMDFEMWLDRHLRHIWLYFTNELGERIYRAAAPMEVFKVQDDLHFQFRKSAPCLADLDGYKGIPE
jgi:hypothetical protein